MLLQRSERVPTFFLAARKTGENRAGSPWGNWELVTVYGSPLISKTYDKNVPLAHYCRKVSVCKQLRKLSPLPTAPQESSSPLGHAPAAPAPWLCTYRGGYGKGNGIGDFHHAMAVLTDPRNG
jgi:hypothetical protein